MARVEIFIHTGGLENLRVLMDVGEALRAAGADGILDKGDSLDVMENWAQGEGRGRTIVVVDDTWQDLALTEARLGKTGVDVVTFKDPEKALAEIARIQPARILTDLNMGQGMDGFEFCRRAREIFPRE